MRGAEPAGLDEPLLELLPGTVEAHLEIAGRDVKAGRDGCAGLLLDIHPEHDLRILRLQRRQQPVQAAADDLAGRLIGSRVQFMTEPFQRPGLAGPLTVQVIDGVSEDPVEPRDQIVAVLQFRFGPQGLEQGVLNDVGREFGIAQAALGKRLESGQVFRKHLAKDPGGFDRGRVSSVHCHFHRC